MLTAAQAKAKNQIDKSRAALVVDHPFFASLLLPMPISETLDVETFATDGESIVYNPNWAATLTQQETDFVLAHETLHVVFDHMGRRENRDAQKWNQAADYVINDLLQKEKIGVMPKGGLLDSALVARGNGSAEGIYKLLPASAEKNKPGKQGGALDELIDGKITTKPGKNGAPGTAKIEKLDPSQKKEKQESIRVRVIQATNAAKMQGALSSGIDRLVKDATKPKVCWKEVLRRFLSERAKVNYSFARPKRRFLASDLYLPSLKGEKLGSLVVAVDCSGSISDELLDKFSAEINAIRVDALPASIEIVYFDTAILRTQKIDAENDCKLDSIRGGGTAFSPIFEYVNKLETQPIACVVLTDLCCNDFGPAPSYPVLWVCLEKLTGIAAAPFGETVHVKD